MRSRTSKKKHRNARPTCIVFIVVHTCQDVICIRALLHQPWLMFSETRVAGKREAQAFDGLHRNHTPGSECAKADLQHQGDCFKEGPTTLEGAHMIPGSAYRDGKAWFLMAYGPWPRSRALKRDRLGTECNRGQPPVAKLMLTSHL